MNQFKYHGSVTTIRTNTLILNIVIYTTNLLMATIINGLLLRTITLPFIKIRFDIKTILFDDNLQFTLELISKIESRIFHSFYQNYFFYLKGIHSKTLIF